MLLLEQGQLSCGTTWRAAGWSACCGPPRAAPGWSSTRRGCTRGWRHETGLTAGFRRCGGLIVARPRKRMTAARGGPRPRRRPTAIEAEMITPAAGPGAVPALAGRRPGRCNLAARQRPGQPGRPDRRAGPGRAAARGHDPGADQGHRHPSRGRRGRPGCPRRRAATSRPRSWSTAPGQWAKQVARLVGVTVPLHSAEHFYVVTEQIDGVQPGPAGAARPGRLYLHQGRGRRPGRRRLRAGRQALGRPRRAALPVRVPAARARTGTTSRS